MNFESLHRWLPDFLWTGSQFEKGVVLVADPSGRILRLSRDPDDARLATRLPRRAMLAGFVNAHSHAFQRAIRGRSEYRTRASRDTFWTWREKMYHAATRLTPEAIFVTARHVFMEMALAGITTVGEFHYLHHQPDGNPYPDRLRLARLMAQAARDAGLRVALLHCAYFRAGWRLPPNPGQTRFLARTTAEFLDDVAALRSEFNSPESWVGVAPHSLRAVPLDEFHAINAYAKKHRLVIHMHVSEQPGENEQCAAEYGAAPLTLLARDAALHDRFTVIHATHIDDQAVETLARAGSTVCACPTTERNLGDGILRAADLLAANVPIALGTDSQIQIAPLEDARQLEYHLRLQRVERAALAPAPTHELGRDIASLAKTLLECASINGARSLGLSSHGLTPGAMADFVCVDLDDPSIAGAEDDALLPAIVFGLERPAVRETAVGGRLIVSNGRHHRQDEFTREFIASQANLWRHEPNG